MKLTKADDGYTNKTDALTVPDVVCGIWYFSLSLTDSECWWIFSRAVTILSLHEADGVESSQYCSNSILQ